VDEVARLAVRERAEHRCEYCRLPQRFAPAVRFHIEHIRARQHRGDDHLENLALACPRCNSFKGPNLASHDPQTDEQVSVFNPRLHLWDEHFALDGVRVVGLTAIGRATVELLNMNEEERLNVRAELMERGEFD
jgi:hypothetical protein